MRIYFSVCPTALKLIERTKCIRLSLLFNINHIQNSYNKEIIKFLQKPRWIGYQGLLPFVSHTSKCTSAEHYQLRPLFLFFQ